MIRIIALLLSGLVIFGSECSIDRTDYNDYWNDIDARVDEYIWDRYDTRIIPASYYNLCVNMMKEMYREMTEHGDEDIFNWSWDYNEDDTISVCTVILTCSTNDHVHYISTTIGEY